MAKGGFYEGEKEDIAGMPDGIDDDSGGRFACLRGKQQFGQRFKRQFRSERIGTYAYVCGNLGV